MAQKLERDKRSDPVARLVECHGLTKSSAETVALTNRPPSTTA